MGTGFTILDDSLGLMLVTNKHVLKSKKNGKYFDSVFVRINSPLNSGKILTTGERAVLHLYYQGEPTFQAHPDSNIDIAIVQCFVKRFDIDTVGFNRIFTTEYAVGWRPARLASRDDFKRLNIRDGTEVQVVGFSFKARQQPQFHISRFGKIALHSSEGITLPFIDGVDTNLVNSEWLILDISSRQGDSGGPVFALLPDSDHAWLIGMVVGVQALNELCMSYPSYYILDLIDSLKARLGY